MKEWRIYPKNVKYLVSTDGEVKNRVTGVLCSVYYPKGVASVKIEDNKGKTCRRSLANMVAVTFIPNPEGLIRVRHINGNRRDNRVENLEWFGKSEFIGTKAKPVQKKEGHRRYSVLDIPNSSVKSYASKKEYITYKGKRYLVSRPVSNPNTRGILTMEKQLVAIKMLKEGKSIEEIAEAIKVRSKQLYLWIEKTLNDDFSLSSSDDGEEYRIYLKEHSRKGSAV